MFRKSLISLIFAGIVVFIGGVAVFAQNAPVTGTVEMLKTDGARVPVEGALVEVFRTDIKASSPPAKTNKRGEFNFAGLSLGWTFILSVSAPGAAPNYMANVKAGQDRLLITLSPGDGTRWSDTEVRAQVAKPKVAAGSPEAVQNTEEMKKAQADYEAKKKEVEDKNKKASQANEIVTAALKVGNEAFAAKNYDLAIAKYDEGIAADPQFVGSAPIFYNNRGISLKTRGVDNYNVGIKAGADATAKFEAFNKAKKDFADAAAGYLNSWNVLKNAPAADISDKANFESNKQATLRGSIEVFQMAVRTEQVDPSMIDAAKVLIPEYQASETDAVKKASASLALADLYRVSGDSVNAIASYKAILETSPSDIDALAGVGLQLVNLGYIELSEGQQKNDKSLEQQGKLKLQEGSNYLSKFVGVAPDTHKYKSDAVGLIETLKKEQNVAPQKVPSTPGKKKP